MEYVPDPDEHIGEILKRVKREYMARQYQITEWKDSEDFLTQVAVRSGKLLKVNYLGERMHKVAFYFRQIKTFIYI